MTRIKFKLNPVWHESGVEYQGRPLLVAETPHNILIRRKGTRQVLSLPITLAYLRAAQIEDQTSRISRGKRRGRSPRIRI